MRGFVDRLVTVLGSRRFYWVVMAFFVLEGVWIALSAVYPMAFDEEFHLGVIRIYSQQWSPFLASQPENANQFGALTADPSYLYHYLMSFPYRLVSTITDNLMIQVVFLRLLNVVMIVGGVVLFRRLFGRLGLSPMLANVAVLLFALIPTVPLLAGQINYDNLLLLLLAWVCLLVFDITKDLRARNLSVFRIGWLAVVLLLASLVKYAFLPMALAVFVYLACMAWWYFRGRGLAFWGAVTRSYRSITVRARFGLLALLVVAAGLFVQRYGVNVVTYGDPIPDCGKVLTVEACMEYGPWGRNYRYATDVPMHNPSPIAYTWLWLQSLHYRLFFVITGPPSYTNYMPALLPSAAAVVLCIFGVVAAVLYVRKLFAGQPFLVFLVMLTVFYLGILWSQNYEQYLQTGRPVAINGRYLIPLLLPLAVVLGRALRIALQPYHAVKTLSAAVLIILFLQGGGLFSFLLRSGPSWYWPNRVVVTVNQTIQDVLSRIVFIGPR